MCVPIRCSARASAVETLAVLWRIRHRDSRRFGRCAGEKHDVGLIGDAVACVGAIVVGRGSAQRSEGAASRSDGRVVSAFPVNLSPEIRG